MQLKRSEKKRSENWISCKKWFLAQNQNLKNYTISTGKLKNYIISTGMDTTDTKIELKSGKKRDR
ncbi:hypothetical protein PAHAL_4G180000 [Panicum hallii]|jgi:hypothetical protein|uniref:Uncharacterized protein n=1 Tax=Panicum hallii TaxID=206008 RepID=A0A2T8JDC2_9POAL|nr:hypothetical protein PAHAL_4G180000 [Panicum hallii]